MTLRSSRVAQGDDLEVDAPPPKVPFRPWPQDDVEMPVVYEDPHVVVVDKPAGLVVHPGAGHARARWSMACWPGSPRSGPSDRRQRPGIVHRLDKGTSGLLVVALTPASYDALVTR